MQSLQDDWFNKDRSETSSNRMPDRVFNGINVTNEALGLNVYKSAIEYNKSINYIKDLENSLKQGTKYSWSEARVTNSDRPVKKARDCVDFKMNYASLGGIKNQENEVLWNVYDEIYKTLKSCVDDYCRYWGINVTYYEVFNFVKYEGEGKEFKIHADDGPMYKAAVSAVIYLNDDYEGGEIFFPRMDGKVIKPSAGDIVIFPSNYIMEHASLPIKEGTKYCVVIMMDLNDLAHQNHISAARPATAY